MMVQTAACMETGGTVAVVMVVVVVVVVVVKTAFDGKAVAAEYRANRSIPQLCRDLRKLYTTY
jgi:hypothetical protein